MNSLMNAFSSLRRTMANVLVAAGLTVSIGSLTAAAQTLPCSWPVESTGTGSNNAAYPDTSATYWVMSLDTAMWPTMVITGEYPRSRFFSFVSYLDNGNVADSVIDSNLAPDPGSTNPFADEHAGGVQNYSLTISRDVSVSGNRITWGATQIGYVIYRVYVPDSGLDRSAGVTLPSVTILSADGNAHPLSACQSAAGQSTVSPALNQFVRSVAASGPAAGAVTVSCPSADNRVSLLNRRRRVVFGQASGGHLFGNPANNYIEAPGLCPEHDKVIVVRAKAAVFPDTHNGGSIFQPAIPGNIQVRYWSMCNNNEVSPYPVVACQPDWATKLDDEGFFTYVVSPDESGVTPPAPPAWLPLDATWLPWGDPTVPNILIFRNMLPSNFTLTAEYHPRGVFCDKQLFIGLGWRACFAAAGLVVP
jgi:hypothetical protein